MRGALDWVFWLLGGVLGAGGLVLAVWALFADRARSRRRCPRCWYDLSATDALVCSECGFVARREKKLYKTRRKSRWACVAAVVLVMAYGLAVTPRIKRSSYHWPGAVPTTALLTCAPWLDANDALASELHLRIVAYGAWDWQQSWYARIWLARYRRASGVQRAQTLRVLGYIGPAARFALPEVMAALREDDPQLRAAAAYDLGTILEAPETSVGALVDLLGDDDEDVRGSAAWALWKFGRKEGEPDPALRASVPALTDALDDESENVRTWSAMALSRIADDPEFIVPKLVEALRSSDRLPPSIAVHALGEMDPEIEGVLPALIEALGHADRHVRFMAVYKLGAMGPRAAPAVPALKERLRDQRPEIAREAADALEKIQPDPAREDR